MRTMVTKTLEAVISLRYSGRYKLHKCFPQICFNWKENHSAYLSIAEAVNNFHPLLYGFVDFVIEDYEQYDWEKVNHQENFDHVNSCVGC